MKMVILQTEKRMRLQRFYDYVAEYQPLSGEDFYDLLMEVVGGVSGNIDLTEEQVRLIKSEIIRSIRLIESQCPTLRDWAWRAEVALINLQ